MLSKWGDVTLSTVRIDTALALALLAAVFAQSTTPGRAPPLLTLRPFLLVYHSLPGVVLTVFWETIKWTVPCAASRRPVR